MIKRTLIGAMLLALAIIGLAYLNGRGEEKVPLQPSVSVPDAGRIVVKGVMVCLPHKNTSGPQTLECAYGLKDDENRYYALGDTDPTYKNISGVPMNIRVEVEGEFTPRTSTLYQDIGVIEVSRVKRL